MEPDELKNKLHRDNLLYEYARIVTMDDLESIQNGYYYQMMDCKWYQLFKKLKFMVGIATIDGIINWVKKGKKQ